MNSTQRAKRGTSWKPIDTINRNIHQSHHVTPFPPSQTPKRNFNDVSPPQPHGSNASRSNGSALPDRNSTDLHNKRRKLSPNQQRRSHSWSPDLIDINPTRKIRSVQDKSSQRKASNPHDFDMSNTSLLDLDKRMRCGQPRHEKWNRRPSEEFRVRKSSSNLSPPNRRSRSKSATSTNSVHDRDIKDHDIKYAESHRQPRRQKEQVDGTPSKTPSILEIIEDSQEDRQVEQDQQLRELEGSPDLPRAHSATRQSLDTNDYAVADTDIDAQLRDIAENLHANAGSPDSTDELQADQEFEVQTKVNQDEEKLIARMSAHPRRRSSRHDPLSGGENGPDPRALALTKFKRSNHKGQGPKRIAPSEILSSDVLQDSFYLHDLRAGSTSYKGRQNLRLVRNEPEKMFNLVYTQMSDLITAPVRLSYSRIRRIEMNTEQSIAKIEFTRGEEDPPGSNDVYIEFLDKVRLEKFIAALDEVVVALKIIERAGLQMKNPNDKKSQEHRKRLEKISKSRGGMDKAEQSLLESHVSKNQNFNKQPSNDPSRLTRVKKKDLLQLGAESDVTRDRSTRQSTKQTSTFASGRSKLAEATIPPERQSRRIRNKTGSYVDVDIEPDMKPAVTEKFSEKHGLGEPWSEPLVYPPDKPNKVTVDFEDLKRLDEDEFLNDNLIQFFLRYFETNVTRKPSSSSSDVHIFNTYFYSTLTSPEKDSKSKINYSRVKRWTTKIDLFSYDYAIVPINEAFHWYAAIICNLRNLESQPLSTMAPDDHNNDESLPVREGSRSSNRRNSSDRTPNLAHSSLSSPLVRQFPQLSLEPRPDDSQWPATNHSETSSRDKTEAPKISSFKDPNQPMIIILDSFATPRNEATRNLKDYLHMEANDKREMEISEPRGLNAKGIPFQTNFADCGVYLLGYIQKFLQDPQSFVKHVVQRTFNAEVDWPQLDTKRMRNEFRKILQKSYKDQRKTRLHSKDGSSTKFEDEKAAHTDRRASLPEEVSETPIDTALGHAVAMDETNSKYFPANDMVDVDEMLDNGEGIGPSGRNPPGTIISGDWRGQLKLAASGTDDDVVEALE